MNLSRESIFVSALRSFAKALFGTIGALIGVGIIVVVFSLFLSKSHVVMEQTTIQIEPDANGKRTPLSSNSPIVLKVNIQGVIGSRHKQSADYQRQFDDSQGFTLSEGRVKAVLLDINSPGGSAIDSDNLYRMIMTYKEKYQVPVYAFVNGLCASGAMYAACAADKIISTPVSIIGSVGVIMGPNFNVYELMQKYGVKQLSLIEGKDKDLLNPYREWSEEEAKPLKPVSEYLYERFVSIVALSRPRLTKENLKEVYGANIYPAPLALEYGYIDDYQGDYAEALDELVKLAKIDGEYQVVSLKSQTPFLQDLIKEKSPLLTGKIKHEFFEETPFNKEPFLYLFKP
ncbi:MAG: S49 family peptidase [Simkaniaceae bacterium]